MPQPPRTARNAAMDLLARREHSLFELNRKLGKRYDAGELDSALLKLAEEGLQSDERFALSFARERMLRGNGPMRIEAELRQRGVCSRFIDSALARVPDEEGVSWCETARAALERKFGDRQPIDLKDKARRQRFLAYRGFGEESAGLIGDV